MKQRRLRTPLRQCEDARSDERLAHDNSDDNCQSMIGPKRESCTAGDEMRAVSLDPLQQLLVADKIWTFLGVPAFEHEHTDMAMAVMGVAQNLSEQNLCNKSGASDLEPKDDGEIPLQQVDLEHGLERVAHVG